MAGTGVLVGVMLAVGEMVAVNVCVGVSVGGSVGLGVSVPGSVGDGVLGSVAVGVSVAGTDTGIEGLSTEYNRIAKRMIAIPIDKNGFLEITGGNFFDSLFKPFTGATASATPSSAKSSLFKAVAYSSWTKST